VYEKLWVVTSIKVEDIDLDAFSDIEHQDWMSYRCCYVGCFSVGFWLPV